MLAEAQWALIFGAAKRRGARWQDLADVQAFKAEVEAALLPIAANNVPETISGRSVSPKGIALIHSFEQCRLTTYPDPGSKDGKPVTGGWGSTVDENGKPFRLGFTAPQDYWNKLFEQQIAKYAASVERLLGDAFTDQSMFDALVSLAYNIGTEALRKSTVLRKHKAGDHAGAAAAFALWVKNDGRVMRGLVRRRAAEASLYLADG